MDLSSLGWDDFFANHFQPFASSDFVPARVVLEHKHACLLSSAAGDFTGICTGRLLHNAVARTDLPAVGDWVVARPRSGEAQADIHAVLLRRTKFSRRAAGDEEVEQIVTALDAHFNLRRIERYLAVAWASGAQPVVVLNKADLHPDPAAVRERVIALASGAPVVTVSAARDADPAATLGP